jgi:ribose transport system permease protein
MRRVSLRELPKKEEQKNIKPRNNIFETIPVIYLSIILLFIVILIFYIGNKSFLSIYNLKAIGNTTAIILSVSLGQLFVLLIGSIDLSVGGIISLVSIVYLISLERFGIYGFFITILIAGLAGLLNGVIYTKLKIPSFITTLGTGGIFVSITYLIRKAPLAASFRIMDYIELVNGNILGINNSWLIAIILAFIYLIIQRNSYIGRIIFSVGSNEKMSWLSGLNVDRTKIYAYLLSGIGSGVAGIILASNMYSGSAAIGELYVLESIAAVVVGGTSLSGGCGGVINTIVGALLMSVIKNGMTVVGIDAYAQQAFLGLLIIGAVAITLDRSKVIVVK